MLCMTFIKVPTSSQTASVNFWHQVVDFLLSPDFQVSFWSALFSGLIVSAVVAFIAYQYTDIFKSPNLSFVVKQGGHYRKTILLNEEGENYKARFQFAIKNNGNKPVKNGQGYWHLYIDVKSPTIFSAPEEIGHSRGPIDGTIYPGSFFDINLIYELSIKKDSVEKSEIPYFFNTDFGQYPRTATVDSSTGKVNFESMGHIKFEIPATQ